MASIRLGLWVLVVAFLAHLGVAWIRICDQPALTLECSAFGRGCPRGDDLKVTGFTRLGGEEMKQIFRRQLEEGQTYGATFAVWVGEELVVSLAGGKRHLNHKATDQFSLYSNDTLQIIFSSGKSLEALAMAILVERGLLDYHEPIAKYWPEFAQGGKDQVTLGDLLRHEGGMAYFTDQEPISAEDILHRLSTVDERLAKNAHVHPGERKRIYHAMMRGVVLDAIVRRVDPQGRDFSTFFLDEISIPLGIAEQLYVKLPEELADHPTRISPFIPETNARVITAILVNQTVSEVLIPLARFVTPYLPASVASQVSAFLKSIVRPLSPGLMRLFLDFGNKSTHLHKSGFRGVQMNDFFTPMPDMWANQPSYRKAGLSSGGIYSNAATVAKVLAIAANGGQFGGRTFWSPKVHEEFMRDNGTLLDEGISAYTTFTNGGVAHLTPDVIQEMCLDAQRDPCFGLAKRYGYELYGWYGAGGSLGMFVPSLNLSVAYVMNSGNGFDFINHRAGEFLHAVFDELDSNHVRTAAEAVAYVKSKKLTSFE